VSASEGVTERKWALHGGRGDRPGLASVASTGDFANYQQQLAESRPRSATDFTVDLRRCINPFWLADRRVCCSSLACHAVWL